jgi:hypothetical protein
LPSATPNSSDGTTPLNVRIPSHVARQPRRGIFAAHVEPTGRTMSASSTSSIAK